MVLMTQIAVTCLFTVIMSVVAQCGALFFKMSGTRPKYSRKPNYCNTYFVPPGCGTRAVQAEQKSRDSGTLRAETRLLRSVPTVINPHARSHSRFRS